jgi:DNA-binding SARP family transcriptional activator
VTHHEVEIAVLGATEVRGAPEPFRRAASRELVVYLGFHREGVRHGDWALALWPDRPVTQATVHSTASDARRALGRAADGAPRLPCGPQVRLHPSVGTDVDRFAALAGSGEWVEAVGLLRGPVFGGLRNCDWPVFDGTRANVEALVVKTVLQGADRLLRSRRPAESEWIVRRGLLVSPYDERLYRALLLALAAQGNRVRLRGAMAELLTVAADAPLPAPLGRWSDAEMGMLHPETTALYQELLCGWPATGGAPARL